MTPATPTTITPVDSSQLVTPEQRLDALRSAIGDSVSAMRRAASIFAAMEEAGDDLSAIPSGIISTLRRIHANTMLPEVAIRYGGILKSRIGSLPLPLQRELIRDDATVEVAMPGGDTVLIHPQRLTPGQIRQVFGDGYIRERAEQLAHGLAAKPGKRGRPPGDTRVSVDKANGVVHYHGHTITKATLLRWINEL